MDRDCIVVGGGPGGMLLAHLLARAGLRVTLLEAHRDFDRRFRGDSLHPWTLELLDELGLADDLLRLPHAEARWFRFHTPRGTITTTDYGRLDSRFPYVALMPQAAFLDFLAQRSATLPGFELRLGVRVNRLVVEDGVVRGVGWRGPEGPVELRARVVVGADGRSSKIRVLAGLPARSLGAQTDILWFTLPRRGDDPPEADVDLYFGTHHYVGLLGGPDSWQVGYSLPKGGYAEVRDAGVEPIRRFLAEHVGWLADRAPLLTDMAATTLLSVEISRVDRWYRPGLLLIGDAAHVISPAGGNGILMALQDAVAAANRLVPALRDHGGREVHETDLLAVQLDREPAIARVQDQQVRTERMVARARERGRAITPPALLRLLTRLGRLRARSARANAYGPHPPRLAPGVLRTASSTAGAAPCTRDGGV